MKLANKTPAELCAEWRKQRALLDTVKTQVYDNLDEIMDKLAEADPTAAALFFREFGKDGNADPSDFFSTEGRTRRQRTA